MYNMSAFYILLAHACARLVYLLVSEGSGYTEAEKGSDLKVGVVWHSHRQYKPRDGKSMNAMLTGH